MILTPNPVLNHVLLANRRFYADFSVYPGGLVPVVGALAVSGGALQAATAGDWLGNIVANGESWTGGPPPTGWTPVDATVVTVDSAVDPGVASGGSDSTVVKVTATGVQAQIYRSRATVAGGRYRASVLAYAPSANTVVRAATLVFIDSVALAAEDAWETLELFVTATGTTPMIRFVAKYLGANATVGDIAYFDSASLYSQNTPALIAGWPTPNFIATLDHISPAAGVVPFSKLIRYENPLNYWEVRVTPNLAGDDLQIMQVTAGVGTPRAAADVDWTSNGLDQLRVVAEGAVIGTEYRKSGAGSWTTGPSWATATQGQGAPGLGPMFWGTGVGRLDTLEVVAR